MSGSGYWLENDFTYGESNTVFTDDRIACSATLTVLDRFGSQLNGYLRAPGKWTLISEGVCELSGLPTSSNHNAYYHEDRIIVGNKMQVQRAGKVWSSGGCCYINKPTIDCPGDCDSRCGSGCEECIAYDPWLGQNKSQYDELVYAWPCFGSLKRITEGRYEGRWEMGKACTRVSLLKYFEWECH